MTWGLIYIDQPGIERERRRKLISEESGSDTDDKVVKGSNSEGIGKIVRKVILERQEERR